MMQQIPRRLRAAALAVVAFAPFVAGAQSAANVELLSLEKQMAFDGGKHFREVQKVIIPTVLVRFVVRGELFVANQGRFFESSTKTARAKGKFVVSGLEKSYVQGIAKQLQDDLVARMRSAGFEVITYADIKDHAEVVKMGRYKPDESYGMPAGSPMGTKNTYVNAFPSDEQAIDPPFQGYFWGFRKLAKEMNAAIMVPEITIDAPLLTGAKRNGISSRGASVSVYPEMIANAYMPFGNAKGAGGAFRMKAPIEDLGDAVGDIGEAKDDSPKFANALAAGLAQLSPLGADMQTKSGTWGMVLKKDAYTAGVLKGGFSFNAAVASMASAEKSK